MLEHFGIKMMKDTEMSQKVLNTLEKVCLGDGVLAVKAKADRYAKQAHFPAGYKHYSNELIDGLRQQLVEAQTALNVAERGRE